MYSPVRDLYVVACYYNPAGFRTKRENYERFVEGLERVGANYRVVECAFGDNAFELPDSPNVLRKRGGHVMWQKERLLNLVISTLPEACTKVAWVDCDLIFEDPAWLANASEALNEANVIQPFTTAVRLPRVLGADPRAGHVYRSFAAVYADSPGALRRGDFAAHGHTGFAWAARRNWLSRHGLYDACLSGSADHLMAHAFCGDTESKCIYQMLGPSGPYRGHFKDWATRVHEEIDGRVVAIPGRVLHMWHGELADRRYHLRNVQLQGLRYDPARDIRLDADGLWRWASSNYRLQHWARALFTLRNEDGAFTFVHDARIGRG